MENDHETGAGDGEPHDNSDNMGVRFKIYPEYTLNKNGHDIISQNLEDTFSQQQACIDQVRRNPA